MVWAAAEKSNTRTSIIIPSTAFVVVIVMVSVAALLLVTVLILLVIGTVAAFHTAVIALLVKTILPLNVTRPVELIFILSVNVCEPSGDV